MTTQHLGYLANAHRLRAAGPLQDIRAGFLVHFRELGVLAHAPLLAKTAILDTLEGGSSGATLRGPGVRP